MYEEVTPLESFYLNQEEPLQSCLLALRDLIKAYSPDITERWYYKLPCFFSEGKIFCYVWVEKKTSLPYIAFYPGEHLTHPLLEKGSRTKSKMLYIQPDQDLPLTVIYEIIDEILSSR